MTIEAITSAMTAIKTAIDIAIIIKDSDSTIENAELKYKLAEMLSCLAETKFELVEIKELIFSKENEIIELKKRLKLKSKIVKFMDAYYYITKNGNPIGEPLCLKCWEVNHDLYHLIVSSKNKSKKVCPNCGMLYNIESAHDMQGDTIE